MIDTVRFKIPLDSETYKRIRSLSHETIKRNNFDGNVYFRVIKDNINLGSYNRKVNLFVYEESTLYIEFSLPKYLFGHNIYLLNVDNAASVCEKLQSELVKRYGNFPTTDHWEIVRLDLCYAWKYQNNAIADKVLGVLRSYKFPKKKLYTYDTSLMFVGTSYSVKFYLKQDEFHKHDFKELFKNPNLIDYAYELLNEAEGVLRFEITYRDKALTVYFPPDKGKILTIHDLDSDKIEKNLGKMLARFLHDAMPEFMTSNEVFNQLRIYYNNTKALNLFQFYMLFHHDDPTSREVLRNNYDRHTINRNIKALSNAKIGLPRKDLDLDLNLAIPSKFVVNINHVVLSTDKQRRDM